MRWLKYWSFNFSIISSKEIPGLIFRMDWLDLLVVQGLLSTGKDPDAGKDWGEEKGTTEDEMAGWHHRLDGGEFE